MPVEPHEPIARYLVQKNQFAVTKDIVKHRAFLPPKTTLETSVFRVVDLTEETIWAVGQEVAEKRSRTLYGRGQLLVAEVNEVGLAVESEEPPRYHANIVGWPGEKEHRLSLAQELAAVASLILLESQ